MSRPVKSVVKLVVLGVDPGLASTGWGAVKRVQGSMFKVQGWGVVKTGPDQKREKRLKTIYDGLQAIIKEVGPDLVAVEEVFFGKNAKTAMMVGQAQGVVMLAAASLGVATQIFTPLQVKNAISGYGQAEKKQVQLMVKDQLGLQKVPRPNHAADALAVALTALFTKPIGVEKT